MTAYYKYNVERSARFEREVRRAERRGLKKDDSIQNEGLRQFLSDTNPFLWAGLNSADPAMFPEFCSIVQQEEIPLEDSCKNAAKYINALPYYYAQGVREAFCTITPEKWLDGVKRYMSSPHKGGNQERTR